MGNTGYKVNPNILFWIRLKTLTSKNNIGGILEVAYIYTDIKLKAYQMGSHIVMRWTKEQFLTADQSQLKLIQASGLYEACVNSNIEVEQAEELIMKDIEFRNIARGQLLAAGKQAHLAKYALMRHMPKLYDFLHYRIFDLSSIQLVVERFRVNPIFQNCDRNQLEENNKNEETTTIDKDKAGQGRKYTMGILFPQVTLSSLMIGEKRANEEVWQDIRQMQFYCQHALNDE